MKLDRRRFLARSALALGAVGAGGAVAATAADAPAEPKGPDALNERVPFDGPHQAGVLTEPRDAVVLASLDAIAADQAILAASLATLSGRARELSQGWRMPVREPDDPPLDSGALGTEIAPDGLTVTIGFGHSLFDDRYGLTAPPKLTRMTAFDGDRLDPGLTHGDVVVLISAHHMDTASHALRELLRPTRDALALRWWIDGFQGADRGPDKRSARRNLFGFRDGTGNPDTSDDALMQKLVWTPGGGTYMAVRLIRMHLEFWDRVGLREQETMIGRRRDTGAPLGGHSEFEDPRLDLDPGGKRIALDAHIRLANPRTAETADQRLLRRAWNYQRGFDRAGQLDQGLIFVAFNQDLQRQFVAVQNRLAGEPMTDYITPVGGGYFYVPRGSRGADDWVGSSLI
ncbi:Dyp-type peroxidase [Solirubrobacter ginsenosidimutans]|uniref:Dyp-type peroxidase n=1 Tax=Solirubrobacter ginsenosidimutans TaxID=490573 RepID=A0A9X3S5T9_9ACTN|nr:Dyp-type peroxidase [Solirubrobacter ginsenosidimutans]MDA0165947.1 Dyp-type peroxidase [Solirubrobacter ginsenosidimutans]